MDGKYSLSALLALITSIVLGSGSLPGWAVEFRDVDRGEWFNRYVEYLSERDVISGYPDQTFRPHKSISRAEFAMLLAKSQNLNTQPAMERPFIDVPATHWASGAIQSAAARGWISGHPDGAFRPNLPITRAEVYAIVTQVLEEPLVEPGTVQDVLNRFPDGIQVPAWARRAVATAMEYGTRVSDVELERLNPRQNATRAEVVTALAKVMNEDFRQPSPEGEAANGSTVNITGVLQPTVEAGGWVVTSLETGQKWLLLDLPREQQTSGWFQQGAPVRVSGTPDPEAVTIYMEGTPLRVHSIEPEA